MKIIVKKGDHEYYDSHIEGRPEIMGIGRTIAEAVGSIILKEEQRFNITIELKK